MSFEKFNFLHKNITFLYFIKSTDIPEYGIILNYFLTVIAETMEYLSMQKSFVSDVFSKNLWIIIH